MQSYSQIVDSSLAYADLAALGSRLKPPKGWQYRSRTLTADLVAPARGEARILSRMSSRTPISDCQAPSSCSRRIDPEALSPGQR
jgi:hypothetical protein